jgi:hypothetical protein
MSRRGAASANGAMAMTNNEHAITLTDAELNEVAGGLNSAAAASRAPPELSRSIFRSSGVSESMSTSTPRAYSARSRSDLRRTPSSAPARPPRAGVLRSRTGTLVWKPAVFSRANADEVNSRFQVLAHRRHGSMSALRLLLGAERTRRIYECVRARPPPYPFTSYCLLR